MRMRTRKKAANQMAMCVPFTNESENIAIVKRRHSLMKKIWISSVSNSASVPSPKHR
jgi:hypothetical protein